MTFRVFPTHAVEPQGREVHAGTLNSILFAAAPRHRAETPR